MCVCVRVHARVGVRSAALVPVQREDDCAVKTDPQCDVRPLQSKQKGTLIFCTKGRTWASEGGKYLAHRALKYGRALRPATLNSLPQRHSAPRQCGGVITPGLSGTALRARGDVTSVGFADWRQSSGFYGGARRSQ